MPHTHRVEKDKMFLEEAHIFNLVDTNFIQFYKHVQRTKENHV